MIRRLPAAAGPLALAVATIALFGDTLASFGALLPSGPRNDLAAQFLAWRDFGFRELAAGRLAFWNPHQFSGTPFFANFESALLYPPNWAHLFFSLGVATNVVVALHVFLAGLTTYFWCRGLGLSRPAATLGGGAFMLSGAVFPRVLAGHLPLLCSLAWAPGVFLAVDKWLESRAKAWIAAGGAMLALQVFAGNPQIVYYTGLGAGLYAALRLRGAPRRVEGALGVLALALTGAALSAVQLIPGLAMVRDSIRGAGMSPGFAGSFAVPPENALTLIAPFLFGDVNALPYYGRSYFWEASLFVGAGALVLAAAGLASAPRWRPLGWLSLAALALSVGPHLPLFHWAYRLIPGFSLFRGPGKLAFLACLGLSALAAAGFDALAAGQARVGLLCKAALLTAAALAALGAAALAGAERGSDGLWGPVMRGLEASGAAALDPDAYYDETFNAAAARGAGKGLVRAAALLAAAAAIAALAGRSRRWAWGLLALAAFELLGFARASRATMALARDYPAPWKEALDRDSGDYRVLHDAALQPNVAMILGLEDLWGYGSLILKRYARFMAASQGERGEPTQYLPIRRRPRVYEMLRCRYVFTASPKPRIDRLGPELPRLFLSQDWMHLRDEAQLLDALLEPDFNPRRHVLLEKEAPFASREGPVDGKAELVARAPGALEVRASLKSPALLVITDAYAPGWKAFSLAPSAPQASYEVIPADYVLRAIPLAAGEHHLAVRYRAPGFRLGAWISLLAFAGLAGWLYFRGFSKRPKWPTMRALM